MAIKDLDKQKDSKVPFDISRAPVGLRAASALVAELGKLDDRFERHYLELKSALDPSKNELAKIAKYILGSANRMPDKAATAFEGYGVMVIGVQPRKIAGLPTIEVLDIDKVVSAYIGPHGPSWDLIYVPVENSTNSVLVILVDPPQDGQDAFLCRKDGDGLSNGRIYIRADGETREARADEVDRLLERGKRSVAAEVGFEVKVIGQAYPVEIDDRRTIDAHITHTVARLLGALPKPEPEPVAADDRYTPMELKPSTEVGIRKIGTAIDPPPPRALSEALKTPQSVMAKMAVDIANFKISGGMNSLLTSDPETRTEEQYRTAIREWVEDFRKAWPEAVKILTAHTLPAVSIRIENKGKTFFNDLELKIHLEGDVDGIEWVDGEEKIHLQTLDLPRAPRIWGPTPRSILGRDIFSPSQYMQNLQIPSAYRSALDWKNGGSVNVTLKVGKLRPKGEYLFYDPELILVLPPTRESHIEGTWQITASGHDEIYSDELKVKVGPQLDLTTTIRGLLKLD